MNLGIKTILIGGALILFGLATIGVPAGRGNLVAGGLFCLTLAYVL